MDFKKIAMTVGLTIAALYIYDNFVAGAGSGSDDYEME